MDKVCSIDGCENKIRTYGWCNKHYLRWYTYGDPLGGRKTFNGDYERFIEKALLYEGEECLLWPFSQNLKDKRGQHWYLGRKMAPSRIVCWRVHGAPPTPKHEAAHSCNNGHVSCVNKAHLRWATSAENSADMVDSGNQLKPWAVVDQYDEIRKEYAKGLKSMRALAIEFGTSFGTIRRILKER